MTSTAYAQLPLTSAEVGTMWMAYQEKTLQLRLIEHLLDCGQEPEARAIIEIHYERVQVHLESIKQMLLKEEAVIPQGFTESDVQRGVPRLFDPYFDILWLRMLSKVQIGLYALHFTMSYRQDVKQANLEFTAEAQALYDQTTSYLEKRNVLGRPPYVSMPDRVGFVTDEDYLKGMRLFASVRSLNTIEIGHMYQAIETNVVGAQMMIGFAQAAAHSEARDYFMKGYDLARKIVDTLTKVLVESGLEVTSTWIGKATNSTISPFSDKLMMYLTNLLTNFGLGSSTIGGAFSLRSDLPVVMGNISKDILTFAKEGGRLMIKHGWMEEPLNLRTAIKLFNKNLSLRKSLGLWSCMKG
ncbi:DUF3231 family protein [Paenibacillus hexagrammi]|uniref:DUF3231 family protein n=1 Tax=Paenibacillus hexagrammi TaxID=2908839 RepID=A0ABY3SM40_9BACL|nr:DUF3231 family protein [Paenibacillus sp. YPD9-1]UJF34284.1 DUF3231 family protein [Paenibacillus sp. YPD9-1]